jgi:hypothetical protein
MHLVQQMRKALDFVDDDARTRRQRVESARERPDVAEVGLVERSSSRSM